MRIIIAGAGELGMYMANVLSNENQDVIVLDSNSALLEEIDASCNVMTYCGDPLYLSVLKSVNADGCGLFLSLMKQDADNILACVLAKELGAERTVAKVNKFHFLEERMQLQLHKMGVDHTVHYEYLAAKEIADFLKAPWAKSRMDLFGGELIVAGMKISANAPIAGMQLKEFSKSNHNFHVTTIVRGSETIIPRGEDLIMAGDVIYFTVSGKETNHLIELTGHNPVKVEKVTVMGGSEIAVRLVDLEKRESVKFKLIEKDVEKCRDVENEGVNCEIIQGDGRRAEVLSYAGEADVFMAVSKSDEVNIMSCVSAKNHGIGLTIAVVEDIQNLSLVENFPIDKVLNRKLVAANYIFQVLLSSEGEQPKSIALADAEIMEVTVAEGAPVTKTAVKKLKLPKEVTLAGMIRNGKGYLIGGDTTIDPGDRIVVACKAGFILKAQKLFQ